MKRVVIVAPDFSPSSLPPALRVRFFATHLPAFGWEPVILSVDPSYYQWSVDPENEALVAPGTRVLRTRAFPAGIMRKLGIGCIGMRSLWHQWRALEKLCRRERPGLVFISVPPYTTMLLGRLAHARFGIPYVIDYIDPWVTDYYKRLPASQRPPKWGAADLLSRTVEPFSLRRVAHLTGVSRGTTDGIVARYPWLTAAQTTEIPYGGELGDFEYLRRHPRRQSIFPKDDGLVHVSYVGRGGSDMNRALEAIFRCFQSGLAEEPAIFQRVRLHFVGTSYAPDATGHYQVLPLARKFGLESCVTEHPARVPYLEAIQILLDSDALLAVGSDSAHYTASKVFPYILAQRPLLAVYHEASSVVDIVRETRAGVAVTFSEGKPERQLSEELGTALRNLVQSAGNFHPPVRMEAFEAYTAKAMTARLARVFDEIAAPATPVFAETIPAA
jgi:hypothetical protein